MNELRFILIMALRDARKNYPRLILFISSVIVGIAALVAINSFNYNLRNQIDKEAASLLGADLAITGNIPADDSIGRIMQALPGEKAVEKELLSMAYLPSTNQTQFVRIKAVSAGFPFYGEIKSRPEEGAELFRNGQYALVDESLMIQHDLHPGDSIRLGKSFFEIVATLTGGVGSIGLSSAVAPTVFIAENYIDSTGLIQPGSLVNYAYYFKLPASFKISEWKKEYKNLFEAGNLRIESIQDRKSNLNQGFDFLNDFLNLTAIIALLLGCLGVASGILIYARSKYRDIALLRCLGIKAMHAFWIYFIQIAITAMVGSIAGASLGAFIQFFLPTVFQEFLPVTVDTSISWRALVQGCTVGFGMSILFALIPLASLLQISPLQILRQSLETSANPAPGKVLFYLGIAAGLLLSTWWLTGHWVTSILFTLAIVVLYVILYLIAVLLSRGAKKLLPAGAAFSLKQGISNLFRPDNQTATIIVTIGMGTAILAGLVMVQGTILKNVALMDAGNQPNMIVYGIESSQKEDIRQFTESFGLPVLQQVPIVTMRIDGWKGKSKSQWLQDSTMTAEKWAFNREARVTYRDTLSEGETLLKGELKQFTSQSDSIFVSLGSTFAEAMDVGIGDEIVFNVQGARLVTYVGSLREIDFRNFSTRFFIVFPTGVLEKAPQFHVLVTKTENTTVLTKYRSELVKKFPNVSAVDLSSVLQSVNEILGKVNFAIRFMAVFSLITGFIVLIGSLALSKYQRIKESVILRTLGASRRRIIAIQMVEYLVLGILASVSGVLLASLGSFLLLKYQFRLAFSFQGSLVLVLVGIITGITVLMGIINSRTVVRSTPLQVLRRESD
jgi:putative ABC transport system permease protein